MRVRTIITAIFAVLFAAVLVVASFVAWAFWSESRALKQLAPQSVLIDSFQKVFFESDSGPPGRTYPIIKIGEPIRARLFGDYLPWHQRVFEENFKIFERLTGYSHSFETSNTNLQILVSEDPDTIREWAWERGMGDDSVAHMLRFACLTVVFNDQDKRFKYAFIVVRLYPKLFRIGHCLIEEAAHAIGTGADRATYSPSVFGDRVNPTKLGLNDKLLLRALYDSRLRTGMTRERAMPIAREVIRELHEAVQEHGEEALYQR